MLRLPPGASEAPTGWTLILLARHRRQSPGCPG